MPPFSDSQLLTSPSQWLRILILSLQVLSLILHQSYWQWLVLAAVLLVGGRFQLMLFVPQQLQALTVSVATPNPARAVILGMLLLSCPPPSASYIR